MASVTVRLFAGAAAAAGCKEIDVEADSVATICDQLREQFGPEFARVLNASSLLVDGITAHRDLDLPELNNGATVDVLPPFAGG